eukprot:8242-Amphidinium_carterae.1
MLRHHVYDCPRHAKRNGTQLCGANGERCATLLVRGAFDNLWPPDGKVLHGVEGTNGSAMYPGHTLLRRAAWVAVALGSSSLEPM